MAVLALTLGAVAYQFSISHIIRGSIAASSSPTPAALRSRSSTLTTMVATNGTSELFDLSTQNSGRACGTTGLDEPFTYAFRLTMVVYVNSAPGLQY